MNTNLTTTSQAIDLSALDRADLADGTRSNYKSAITRLFATGIDPFDYEALANYANTLHHSIRANLKASINIMTAAYENALMAGATVDNLATTQVQLLRVRAINKAIKVHAPKGTKSQVWLSREQVEQITALPDRSTPMGKRDWIILAALFASGLRRSELAEMTFDALKRQPMRNGQFRDVLEVLHGKGDKARVIPISKRLADGLREWHALVGDGRIARSVNKAGKINGSLSDKAVTDIVKKYGNMIGVDLAAHGARRTFNQLSYEAGTDIIQLKEIDGHESIATTEKYLNKKLNLENTPSDTIPLSQ